MPATPPESSVKVSVAASAAAVDGVNVMLTKQVLPGPGAGGTAVLFLQVVVPPTIAKSAALAPEMATALAAARFSVSVPVLVSVTASAPLVVPFLTLPNGNGFGAAEACGKVPVPLKVTVCTVPATAPLSSVIVTLAFCAPVAVGANFTLNLQFAPAATGVAAASEQAVPELGAPNVNWLAFAPVNAILAIFSVSVPVLLTVTSVPALVVPLR